MERMIFQADEELLDRLRTRAREQQVSVAQVIREAIERELGAEQTRPRPRLGIASSDEPNLSTHVDELYRPDPWRS